MKNYQKQLFVNLRIKEALKNQYHERCKFVDLILDSITGQISPYNFEFNPH